MISSRERLAPGRSHRHAIVATRLGIQERELSEWIGQNLGGKYSGSTVTGHDLAPWEDINDPNFSTYQKGDNKYPPLHPSAKYAILRKYQRLRENTKTRIAFVSAISDGYEAPKWHEHLIPSADYLLFSESFRHHPLFQVKSFHYFNIDPTRTARFVKTHPHVVATGYEVAVWVDGNILIRGDLSEEIESFIQSGLPIGAIHHPLRKCIYEEAEACIERSKDDQDIIGQQVARYRANGVSPDFLIESNLMMFRVDHPQLAVVMNRWWGEIENGSRRDQISLPYVMQACGVECHWITPPGTSVRNHRKLVLVAHEPSRDPALRLWATDTMAAPPFREVRDARLAAQAGRRMDVVVCVHNALDCVTRCLHSVAANRDASCHRIIIVNDGSGLETRDWLRDFVQQNANCHLIEHDFAQGYTRAANAGMRASDGEALVLLNSDTEVAPNWIEKLFDAFDSFPGVGIVGPMSNAASHQSLPEHLSRGGNTAINELPDGFSVADMDRWCEDQSDNVGTALVPLVHGFCFAIRRESRDAIGLFDEQAFPLGYGEENDFCLRAANAGFLLAVALHTFVYHEKSKTYETEKRQALMKNGSDKLREIYGRPRVMNAVRSMQENPALSRLRSLSRTLPSHAQ